MADLIDRNASIRFISNIERDDEDRLFSFEEIKKMLRDAPAVNSWIPCSERLPDNANPCAVITECGAIGISRLMGRNLIKWTVLGDSVTHWMPLPEPPEKE